MLIIPAIDLKSRQCVRLRQGRAEEETVFSSDPLAVARRWKKEGAKRLHIIDLDAALDGVLKNFDLVLRIKEAAGLPIQLGGGIRSKEIINNVFSHGIDKVIITTLAVKQPELLKELVGIYGDKIVVSVDVFGDKVAVHGWQEKTVLSSAEFGRNLKSWGVKEIIYTDIQKDGTLSGINAESIKKFLEEVKLSLIVAGGVSSLEDIKKLLPLQKLGVTGAILGRAIYTGNIDFSHAVKLAEGYKQ
ncbi:MAG: 1-(5-phosphoribosyl)-5-[(5-phosphoribosylamino)methylideneamino]imidazole-4-carboxamide isomerase [Elusimicrobiota bacterium]